MKIVLSPCGSRGDVYPVIYLGRELKKRGHEIHIVTSPDHEEICNEEEFAFYSAGTDFRILMDEFKSYMGKPLKVMQKGLSIFNNELESFYKATSRASQGADMLVASGLQLTSFIVAEEKAVPYRYMAHIPILIPSKYHSPYFVPFQNLPKWVNSLLWNGNNMITEMTVGKTLNRIRKRSGLLPRKGIMDHIDIKKMVIAVAPELGVISPDNKEIGLQVDYLFNPDEGELSKEITDFINAGEPPIYFGFGSMTDGHPEKTLDIIFRSVEKLNARAIISRGWANYCHVNTPESVFFAGEEPHGKLFPKMKAIVHHGGAGTTSSAAMAGVPQITTPHVLDQFYWTNRIKTLGLGPGGIKKGKFNVKNLTNKLNEAFENKEIIRSAEKIGNTLANRNGIITLANEIEKEIGIE